MESDDRVPQTHIPAEARWPRHVFSPFNIRSILWISRKMLNKRLQIIIFLPHMGCDSFRIVDTILFFCFETIYNHFKFSFWVNHGEIDTILVRTAAQLALRMFCLNWVQVDDWDQILGWPARLRAHWAS